MKAKFRISGNADSGFPQKHNLSNQTANKAVVIVGDSCQVGIAEFVLAHDRAQITYRDDVSAHLGGLFRPAVTPAQIKFEFIIYAS